MAQTRIFIALGVAATLVISALAIPSRSVAQSSGQDQSGLSFSGWTKIDSNTDYLTQDKDSVLIYSPYRRTLTVISKYQNMPARVIKIDPVKPKADE